MLFTVAYLDVVSISYDARALLIHLVAVALEEYKSVWS